MKKPQDERQKRWPADLLRDHSKQADVALVEGAWGLQEYMHESDSDGAEQRRMLAGATPGQLKLVVALYYMRVVMDFEWEDFGSFLASESGWSAALVADGLEAMGAAKAAGLIRKLLAGLPDPVTLDAVERARIWEAAETPSRNALNLRLAKELERLDIDSLYPGAAAYIRKHPDEFFVRPQPTKN